MLPESDEILGFAEGETGIGIQKENLNNFNMYSKFKFNTALKEFGIKPLNNIHEIFKGVKTLLWDFQEFLPLPCREDVIHVGPVEWGNWPKAGFDIAGLFSTSKPLAVLSFGTCTNPEIVFTRISKILLNLGFNVLVVNPGQMNSTGFPHKERNFFSIQYAPMRNILPHASILISHGGQMTIFEAIQHRVPALILPFQPEQAHNGVCIERINCGKRLIPAQVFRGSSRVYIDAFNALPEKEIGSKIISVMNDTGIPGQLIKFSEKLNSFHGAESVAGYMENI